MEYDSVFDAGSERHQAADRPRYQLVRLLRDISHLPIWKSDKMPEIKLVHVTVRRQSAYHTRRSDGLGYGGINRHVIFTFGPELE